MSNQIEKEVHDSLCHLIKQYPLGASIDDIQNSSVGKDIPKRTLQRWLKNLVQSNEISVVGKARSTRYQIKSEEKPLKEKISEEKEPYEIPLSKESKRLIQLIEQPIQKRKPVGYKRSFLDSYAPNKTEYLSQSLKSKLLKLGTPEQIQQPAGTYATKIFHRLLIDLSWNSSRLEGNTYSLLDTKRLIEQDEVAFGKNVSDTQMILNHKSAIEFLVQNSQDINFNRSTILNVHALLSDNLLNNPAASGYLRKIQVEIAHTVFEPLNMPQLIEECFVQVLDTARAIKDPFEQAFFAMVHLPYLQPFEDVNKRVSRLACNIPFIKKNLCPISFIDVPERSYIDGIICVYEQNRIEILRDVFEWAYERSCARYLAVRHSLGEADPFRLKYHLQFIDCIGFLVRKKCNKKQAAMELKKWSLQHIDKKDRREFETKIWEELNALHEGNFARFRIKVTEFELWMKFWIIS
jgi:hypothetical protein